MHLTRLTTRTLLTHSPITSTLTRLLSTTPSPHKQPQHPPRLQIPDSDIKHVFVLGGGSGGQVINKTSSAAQLTHLPTGIVVKSQATRSRSQNYKIARQILADKVDERLNGKESRVEVKRARAGKKKASADKKKRRKYRALEEGKLEVGEGENGDEGEGDEDVTEESIEEVVKTLRQAPEATATARVKSR